jgi:23S rRNA (uracil1939-C5)-methyltransferase
MVARKMSRRSRSRNKSRAQAFHPSAEIDSEVIANFPEFFIESLDLEGRGVSKKEDGKVLFIEGALPFERVKAQINTHRPKYEEGVCAQVLKGSSQRVQPECEYFGIKRTNCGGCKTQHLHPTAQVAVKQRVLEDNLWHIGRVKPDQILRAVQGPQWGYRFRARLSVRYVKARGHALVGFHERQSRYIADIHSCKILPKHVSDMLLPLRDLVSAFAVPDSIPQIEVACGEEITALVLRHLEPLSPKDLELLEAFAQAHQVQWWLQPKGPDSLHLMQPSVPSKLSYSIEEFGIKMPYRPADFTQVNPHINQVLVSKAIKYLQLKEGETVIDWFCGLGNFTLPLATTAAKVLGIEGSDILVQRAKENYDFNQQRRALQNSGLPYEAWPQLCPTEFVMRNLFEMTPEVLWADGQYDKWLVDPPREGCMALVQALAHICKLGASKHQATDLSPLGTWTPPKRIVYVSCNPSTLARDAQILVHEAGYKCTHAGVVNMFPQTAHVESVAVFEWPSA